MPTSVPVKEEAPTLPATGEKSTAASATRCDYGDISFGFVRYLNLQT